MNLAFDYDGVIADTNSIKSRWIRENLGLRVPSWKCDYTQSQQIIGRENFSRMAPIVYGREATLHASPVPGARQGLVKLSKNFGLFIVTARPVDNTRWAEEWLQHQGLRDLFEDIVSSSGTTKAEVVERIDARALLEDDVRHLTGSDHYDFEKYHLAPNLRVPYKSDGEITHVRTWRAFSLLVMSI